MRALCAIISPTRENALAKGGEQRFFPIALGNVCVQQCDYLIGAWSISHCPIIAHSIILTHSLTHWLPNSRSARIEKHEEGAFYIIYNTLWRWVSSSSSRLQAASSTWRDAFLRPAGAAAAWLAGRSGPNLLVRPKVRGPWAPPPPPLLEKCLSCASPPSPRSHSVKQQTLSLQRRRRNWHPMGTQLRMREGDWSNNNRCSDQLPAQRCFRLNFLVCARPNVSRRLLWIASRAETRWSFYIPSALSHCIALFLSAAYIWVRGQQNSPLLFGSVCVSELTQIERAITHICVCRQSVSVSLQGCWIKKLSNNGDNLTGSFGKICELWNKIGFPFQILWKSW